MNGALALSQPMSVALVSEAESRDRACDALVLFIAAPGLPAGATLQALDTALGGSIAELAADGEFSGGADQAVLLHVHGRIAAKRLLLVGLGEAGAVTPETWRRASAVATRKLASSGAQVLDALLPETADPAAAAQAIVEGVLLAAYDFAAYRSAMSDKRWPRPPCALTLRAADAGADSPAARGLARGRAVGEATAFARDLCNHPGNVLTPRRFAEVAENVAREHGMHATVHDERGLEQLGMGGLLGVAAGSREPPRLVVLEYTPDGTEGDAPLVMVGKTVTFDSGGISLKVALDMEQMKADMTGGAAVLAALRAAARLKVARRIVAIFAAVENMPGGGATRPGDILTLASGATVEVLNTDAEGRLILADALHHARSFNPECVIDVATLTGASAVVFGSVFTALFSSSPTHAERMREAGEFCGERTWPMPLAPEYGELLRSPIADLRNIGGALGGMPIAAAFLAHFTQGLRWLHLDIYNTCWNNSDHPYLPKGPTGSGTRLLTQFLLAEPA